jgi:oligopeptide transport system substrate-binding protein
LEDLKMNRLARWLLLTLVLVLALAAGTVTAQDEPKILVTAAGPGDPRSIDPQQAFDTKDWNLENVLFPALNTLNEETREIAPGLAESWEVSDDGLVYTFHLLQNVPWVRYNADSGEVEQVMDDSGNPRYVTAHDVVFGWTRALDPAVGSPAAFMLAPLIVGGQEFNAGEGSAEDLGIRAVDDFTFEVTAPEAVGYALGIYGIINARPTPQWAIEAAGDAWTEPENINTYGPFALKEWVHDDHITYIRNPFWPGSEGYGQAILDELVVRFLDAEVQMREYEAGNLDVVPNVPGTQFDRVSTDPTLSQELTVFAGMCTGVWAFHTEKPPFDNVHIRRAFNYAVDRESLVANVIKGGQIPSRWYTPPSVNFAPTPEDNPDLGIVFNAETAQQELQLGLEELGLASAADLPAISVVFGNTEGNNAIGQALQVMWQDTLGVTVELNPLDTTTYWSTMAEDAGQIHAAGWCPDYNDANNYTRDVMYSTGIYNYGRWNSPEFDALVDEARTSTDNDRRRELYAQAEQLMVVEDAAVIPLVWNSIATLTKPYVTRTFAPNNVESYWKWDINR